MISWDTIVYGAALTLVAALAAVFLLLRERNRLVLVAAGVAAIAGPVAWNAVLHSMDANDFFVDAPLSLFPVSWQDTGTGVWTLALAAIGQCAVQRSARRAGMVAVVVAAAALVVDVYLY